MATETIDKTKNIANVVLNGNPRIQLMKENLFKEERQISLERAILYTESYQATEGESVIIRRAKATAHILENVKISIRAGELLVGNRTIRPRSGILSPEMDPYWIIKEIDTIATRPQDQFVFTEEDKKIYLEQLYPYWQNRSMKDFINSELTEEVNQALADEVLQDEIFFRTSGGGVTLSGGEVLMQYEFAAKLLQALHDLGIHTAIETTGCFPVERIKTLAPYLNQVLFDLKIMDEVQAKNAIGINVKYVKENFEYLLSQNQLNVIPRIPLIPRYTVKKANLEAIIAYLKSVHVLEVHLLPFHQYGSSKYQYLGWDYQMKDVATLTPDELAAIRAMFESAGILTNVDGLE